MAREKMRELFKFPMKGVHRVGMKNEQPEGTCFDALNVRPFDTIEARARGGSRPGLGKYSAARGSDNRVQDLNRVTTIATALSATSMSRRTVTPVQVTNGVIAHFNTTAVTNATVAGSQALGNATQSPFCFSAELFGKLYFADGRGYKVYNQTNTTAYDWTASAGSLPGDIGNNVTCRLIEAWRGRLVLSGLGSDPHNWFMTKLGSPLDFDYAPVTPTELDAVTGGAGFIGKVPDIVNAIIPYTDDVLLFGCDHSIWMMSGDPQAGGRLDLVTNTVGMAFGRPYTQLPDGTLMFFSNRGSVYRMAPGGGKPQNITEDNIDPLITNTNLNTTICRMAYDEKAEGVHMWLSPLTTGAAIHWYYDIRSNGWFRVIYGHNDYNPVAMMIFEGDDPDDREILIGSEDGYVRQYKVAQTTDDGTNFNSFAIIGPIVADKGRYPCVLTDVQFIMDDTSANTIYEIGVGDTAEAALADFAATFTGETTTNSATITIQSGKSQNINPRTRGYFQYFKIGVQNAPAKWAIEYIQAGWSIVKSSLGRAFMFETISFADPDDPPILSSTGLHSAFWAEKNITQTANAITTWTPYQLGSGVSTYTLTNSSTTKPVYIPNSALMGNKPAVYVGGSGSRAIACTVASATSLTANHGFITIAGYVNTFAAGVVHQIKDGNGTDAIQLLHASGPDLQLKDTVGAGNTQTSNTAFVLNTAYVFTIGTGNPNGPWRMWQNQVKVLDANLGLWWADVDDATNGLTIQFGGSLAKLIISAFAIYTAYDNTVITSVEDAFAARFGITF